MSVPAYPGPAPGDAAPAYRRSELKVACVQFDIKVYLQLKTWEIADGQLGEVEKNRAKVEEMTRSYVFHVSQ